MSLEFIADYSSLLSSLERAYVSICLKKDSFTDFQPGIKMLNLEKAQALVTVNDNDFPTGFILLRPSFEHIDLDVFVSEANKGNKLAQKLTKAAEDFVGEGQLLRAALSIPKDLPEHEKMRTMLVELGFRSNGNIFLKET